MKSTASPTAEFVRRLGSLDERFGLEYGPDLANAESYPYGVLSFFEAFLCQLCKSSLDVCEPLLRSTVNTMEVGLSEHYDELQNMVEVAFFEKLFHDDHALFGWMVAHSGPLLRYELLAYSTRNRAYRIINSVRGCFSDPPVSSATLMASPMFVETIRELGVPHDGVSMLDVWGHPYHYHVDAQQGVKDVPMLIHVTSFASDRGHGRDIEVVG